MAQAVVGAAACFQMNSSLHICNNNRTSFYGESLSFAQMPRPLRAKERLRIRARVAIAPPDLETAQEPPMNLFKPKTPYTATIKSVERIVGPKAPGETCHIVIDHEGNVPYWEGQSYGVIPPGENPKKPGTPNAVRLYSIASTRYGDDFDGRTASLCVRHSQVLEGGVVESKKLGKHWGPDHKLAIEPGSPRTFFSCGEDGVVKHFDLREAKHSKLLTCHSYEEENRSRHLPIVRLNAIDINPRNPNYFAVGGSDKCARVYDLRKIDADASSGKDQPVDYFVPAHLMGTSHYVHITSLVFSQQQELLVSYNNENIYLFQKNTGLGACPMSEEKACLSDSDPQVYQGHRNVQTVKGVNFFGPSSEYVVSGSNCGNLFI